MCGWPIPRNTRESPDNVMCDTFNLNKAPATSFPWSYLYFENGWSREYACQPKLHRGWVINLILSTLSREVNIVLLCRLYFEKEASYLSEILPGWLLQNYLNLYEYEMLIETERLCLYFTAFLNNRQQPASD